MPEPVTIVTVLSVIGAVGAFAMALRHHLRLDPPHGRPRAPGDKGR